METPPALPPSNRPPLGKKFCFTLLAPVAVMALAAALSAGGRKFEDLSFPLSLFSLLGMFVCANICGVWIGKRNGVAMGFLAFFGVAAFYIAIAFAGCAALFNNQPMNFH